MSEIRAFPKSAQRLIPYIVLLLIALPVIWPFISRESLPSQTDAELHIFRLAELSRLIRGGVLYPRWAPNFYFGYGYPIFNYYAPFSYYVGFLFDILPVVDPVGATKSVFVLGLLLGGLGTYGFVNNRWGRPAGYVGAALFLFSPYIQYIDPHARGVLAESFSLGLFPLAIWLLDEAQRKPRRWNITAAAFALSGMVLSHNLMAMIGSGLILAWLVWQTWRKERTGYAWFAFVAGLLMSMFFWIPVALERNAVNLSTVVGEEGSHFAFSNHFLAWRTLLAPSLRLDWGATEPAYRFNLGIIQWASALVGIVMLFRGVWGQVGFLDRRSLGHEDELRDSYFWLVALVGLLFLMFPISSFVWRSIPVMPFIQFPWRLLGAVAFVAAVLGASFIRRRVTASLVIGGLVLLAMPLIYVAPWDEFGPTDVATVAFYETRGRWLGTTSTADFLPGTVDVIPKPESLVMDVLKVNGVPERINRYTVPKDANIAFEAVSPLHFRYQVDSPKPFQFRLYLFQFPGWQVRLDGNPIEPELGRPEGFIVVPMEAGKFTVDVFFGSTGARRAGWLISLLGFVVLATVLFLFKRDPDDEDSARTNNFVRDWPIGLTVLIVFVVLLLLPDRLFHFNSVGETVEIADAPLLVDFGNQVSLLGADFPAEIEPGNQLDVTLYWKANGDLDVDYQVFVHLIDRDGNLVAQSDKLNPGDFPTRRWPTDKYVRDPHQLVIPNVLVPGDYSLTTGLWVQSEGWRLPVLDSDGDTEGDVYHLSRYSWDK